MQECGVVTAGAEACVFSAYFIDVVFKRDAIKGVVKGCQAMNALAPLGGVIGVALGTCLNFSMNWGAVRRNELGM